MARYTITNMPWGELKVTHTVDGQHLRSVCKACAHVTEQQIAVGENSFQAVKPVHRSGCRFGAPATVRPVTADTVTVVQSMLPWKVSPALLIALVVALLVLAFLGGHAL